MKFATYLLSPRKNNVIKMINSHTRIMTNGFWNPVCKLYDDRFYVLSNTKKPCLYYFDLDKKDWGFLFDQKNKYQYEKDWNYQKDQFEEGNDENRINSEDDFQWEDL